MLAIARREAPRTVEGRLSGSVEHFPCSETKSDGRVLPKVSCSPPLDPDSAAGRTLAEGLRHLRLRGAHGEPQYDFAMGRSYLALQQSGLDRAVQHLERMAEAHPRNPAGLNDLAVVLLARAHRDDRPADLVAALDLIERALAEAPDDPAARFNRALAVERLGLTLVAGDLWRAAADAQPDSPWQEEARLRSIDRTTTPSDGTPLAEWAGGDGQDQPPAEVLDFCARSPVRVTRNALSQLFPAWADASMAGDREAAERRLDRLGHLGACLLLAGEPTVAESVRRLREAPADRRQILARAYQAFGEGDGYRRRGEPRRAESSFLRAAEAAGNFAEPLRHWSRHAVAAVRNTAGDPAGARVLLERLSEEATAHDYPALTASRRWTQGLIEARGGAFADARASFATAAEIYARLGDLDRSAGARALAAESLFALGLSDEAWRSRREALFVLGTGASLSLHNLLLDASLAASEEGFALAGLTLREVDLRVAESLQRPTTSVESRIWFGRMLGDLGRTQQAADELETGLGEARRLADPGLRARLVADAQEARGALKVHSEPAAAVAALGEALSYYQASDYRWKVPTTLFSRVLAWRRLGEDGRARADLAAVAAEFERRDVELPPAVFRFSHFERAQAGFDEWIRLEAEGGRMEAALAVTERARRVQLFTGNRSSMAAPPEGSPGALDRAIASLPEGTALIEYAVTGDSLLTWVIHQGVVRGEMRSLGDLPRRIERFALEISYAGAGGEGFEVLAGSLYRDLVAPWIESLPKETRLVFAPDRILHRVPFAALRNPATGRWLAEDRGIASTPGLLFFSGFRPPRGLSHERRGVLLVGDPAFDPAETGSLESLHGAADEVADIARIYPASRRLTGADATRSAVVAALGDADIVHYAGHGVATARNPWNTFFPLARPSAEASGLLLASDVHGLSSGPWKVVVLSACGSTASAGRLRTAGFQAMVNAFLAAGAEAVIASRWPVDDQRIRPFAVEIHRGLAGGQGAAEALESARRKMLRADVPVSVWASFEVTGRSESASRTQ
ncbi:MAG: CHAT domain-containing protein [Acidobacteriota bacterium]